MTKDKKSLRQAMVEIFWEEWHTSKSVTLTSEQIGDRLMMLPQFIGSPNFRNQISAQLSKMRSDGLVVEAGATRSNAGRHLIQHSLIAILDLATKPSEKTTDEINAAIQRAKPGPTATHVNRPPMNSPSKEEFERKEASKDDKSAPETNAVGETVRSVPAAEFRHYDGNSGSGKLTTERRPKKPQDPNAIAEMVQHLRKTEGSIAMSVGAPKHGTEESVIAQYAKTIARLEGMLEKAISQITVSNREGIAKQEIANAETTKAMANVVQAVKDVYEKDAHHTTEVLNEFIEKLNENNAHFREGMENIVKLWLDMHDSQRIVVEMITNMMNAMKDVMDSRGSDELVAARAFTRGWDEAKKTMAEESSATMTFLIEDSPNEKAKQAEDILARLGITDSKGEIPKARKVTFGTLD